MNDRIPNLTIERAEDGGFLLEQDDCSGNVDRIELHPTQVRHLAELAGLLPRRGDDYTPPLPVLARRLRVLLDRINELDDRLHIVAQYGREDLDHELSFSLATWELATEFCADLAATGNTPKNGAASSASTPESGVVESPQKRGHSQLELEA